MCSCVQKWKGIISSTCCKQRRNCWWSQLYPKMFLYLDYYGKLIFINKKYHAISKHFLPIFFLLLNSDILPEFVNTLYVYSFACVMLIFLLLIFYQTVAKLYSQGVCRYYKCSVSVTSIMLVGIKERKSSSKEGDLRSQKFAKTHGKKSCYSVE